MLLPSTHVPGHSRDRARDGRATEADDARRRGRRRRNDWRGRRPVGQCITAQPQQGVGVGSESAPCEDIPPGSAPTSSTPNGTCNNIASQQTTTTASMTGQQRPTTAAAAAAAAAATATTTTTTAANIAFTHRVSQQVRITFNFRSI